MSNAAPQVMTVQAALAIARESDGEIDPAVLAYLENALQMLWDRVLRMPDSYIMTKDEFALFNFHRHQYSSSSIVRGAVARFWNNYIGNGE